MPRIGWLGGMSSESQAVDRRAGYGQWVSAAENYLLWIGRRAAHPAQVSGQHRAQSLDSPRIAVAEFGWSAVLFEAGAILAPFRFGRSKPADRPAGEVVVSYR